MHFDIGDPVLLVHSGEEGVVVAILDEDMVSVRVHGTVIPVATAQLDYPYFKRFTERRAAASAGTPHGQKVPVDKTGEDPRVETGVFLSFLPEYEHAGEEALVRTLKIHLLNETAADYRFRYRLLLRGSLELEVENRLFPFRHFYLQDLPFESLNDRPRFELQFSLTEPAKGKREVFPVVFKPKARQIIGQLHELRESGKATFSELLFPAYPDAGEEVSWDTVIPSPSPRFVSPAGGGLPPPRNEVDLHIEKLVDHPRGLSPSDMLGIQLTALQKELELAIAHRQPSLVVIHGLGKGVLRQEVHEILRHVPEVKSFINQYHARYGYGATEIFFEYK